MLTLPVLPGTPASQSASFSPPTSHSQAVPVGLLFKTPLESDHFPPLSLSPRWLLWLSHWPPSAFVVPVMSPLHIAGIVILLKQDVQSQLLKCVVARFPGPLTLTHLLPRVAYLKAHMYHFQYSFPLLSNKWQEG